MRRSSIPYLFLLIANQVTFPVELASELETDKNVCKIRDKAGLRERREREGGRNEKKEEKRGKGKKRKGIIFISLFISVLSIIPFASVLSVFASSVTSSLSFPSLSLFHYSSLLRTFSPCVIFTFRYTALWFVSISFLAHHSHLFRSSTSLYHVALFVMAKPRHSHLLIYSN